MWKQETRKFLGIIFLEKNKKNRVKYVLFGFLREHKKN